MRFQSSSSCASYVQYAPKTKVCGLPGVDLIEFMRSTCYGDRRPTNLVGPNVGTVLFMQKEAASMLATWPPQNDDERPAYGLYRRERIELRSSAKEQVALVMWLELFHVSGVGNVLRDDVVWAQKETRNGMSGSPRAANSLTWSSRPLEVVRMNSVWATICIRASQRASLNSQAVFVCTYN